MPVSPGLRDSYAIDPASVSLPNAAGIYKADHGTEAGLNSRDILLRLTGGIAIALGYGSALLLRAETFRHPADSPTLLEFFLVLTSFVLTLAGAVLALNGARGWMPGAAGLDRDDRGLGNGR